MAVLVMISTFGCNNGMILTGARVYWAMARDGLFDDLDVNSSKLGGTVAKRNEKLVKLLDAIGDLAADFLGGRARPQRAHHHGAEGEGWVLALP